MQKHLLLTMLSFLVAATLAFAQKKEVHNLLKLQEQLDKEYRNNIAKAKLLAKDKGWPVVSKQEDGSLALLVGVKADGTPHYLTTLAIDAAITTNTSSLWAGGNLNLDLSGSSMPSGSLGMWEVSKDFPTTHVEYTGRINIRDREETDESLTTTDHAAHVAGIMMAEGILKRAKGMAHGALLDAYSSSNDNAEMAGAAEDGMLISNHSYGSIEGWRYNFYDNGMWVWFGDTTISTQEDWEFGFYNNESLTWDDIARRAPNYLIVKSIGNDRNDFGPAPGEEFLLFDRGDTVRSTISIPADGGELGYDTAPPQSVSKNILTIGAVTSIPTGYQNPEDVQIAPFSGFGPADDGRIKPDIVGAGVNVFSTSAEAEDAYITLSGTSMAAPNVAGSLLLLQEYYFQLNNQYLTSASLKNLAIHTANEAGEHEGPDYRFGWGLFDAEKAARHIGSSGNTTLIEEGSLANSASASYEIYSTGVEPLKVSLVWTDVAGSVPFQSLDPETPNLVNDLDIRVQKDGQEFFPYILDKNNPANAATTGDNLVDNVETVYLANAEAGLYTLTVSHKGQLVGGDQSYSILASGINNNQIDAAAVSANATVGYCDFSEDTPIELTFANVAPFNIDSLLVTLEITKSSGDVVTTFLETVYNLEQAEKRSLTVSANLFESGTYQGLFTIQFTGDQNSLNDSINFTLQADRINVQDAAYLELVNDQQSVINYETINQNGDEDENGNTYQWNFIDSGPNARSGEGYFSYYANPSSSANDYLVSPCFYLEQDTVYSLSFWHRNRLEEGSNTLRILYGETDVVEEMEELEMFTELNNFAYENKTIFFRVPSTGSYNIAWHLTSQGGNGNFYMDDIGLAKAPTFDLAVSEIRFDATPCDLGTNTSFEVLVSNPGLNTVSSETVSVRLNNEGGLVVEEQLELPEIESGETATLAFSADFSIGSLFTIEAVLGTSVQTNTLNDTLVSEVAGRVIIDRGGIFEDFESTNAYDYISVSDANNDTETWTRANPVFARSGSEALVCLPALSGTSDDWLFTNCYELLEGKNYQISSFVSVFDQSSPVDLEIHVSSGLNVSDAIETLKSIVVSSEEYVEASAYFTPSTSGKYNFAFRNTTPANETAAIFLDDLSLKEVDVLTLEQEIRNDIRLFPNPAKDFFNLEGLPESKETTFNVIDVSGKRQLTHTTAVSGGTLSKPIDISALKAGIYILQFSIGNEYLTYSIIKE